MKKLILVLFVVVILLVGGYFVYNNIYLEKNKGNDFDAISEKESFNNDLESIEKNLGLLVILNSVHNYNDGGKYEPDKGKNLIGDVSDKQLFVMEQILLNTSNYSKFVILDTEGKEEISGVTPSDEYILAYYPYDLFNIEYKKYFNDNFDIDNRIKSNINTKYDNDDNYIYYENKKLGLNGVGITKMEVNDISYDDKSNVYTSNVKINYTDRAKNLLNVDSHDGIIKYVRDKDNLYLVSFEVSK